VPAPTPPLATSTDTSPATEPEPPPAVVLPSRDATADAEELERLRLLQDAAERHAFDADRAIAEGENGDQDASFNRNARLAATLARTRHALAKPKHAEGENQGAAEVVTYNLPKTERDKPEG
jgi:hypothetical protein